MKKQNLKKPFFSNFLENQLDKEKETSVQGGLPNHTMALSDSPATKKYPSDNDEDVTLKHPSDADEDVSKKYPSDNDEATTQKYPSDGDDNPEYLDM